MDLVYLCLCISHSGKPELWLWRQTVSWMSIVPGEESQVQNVCRIPDLVLQQHLWHVLLDRQLKLDLLVLLPNFISYFLKSRWFLLASILYSYNSLRTGQGKGTAKSKQITNSVYMLSNTIYKCMLIPVNNMLTKCDSTKCEIFLYFYRNKDTQVVLPGSGELWGKALQKPRDE